MNQNFLNNQNNFSFWSVLTIILALALSACQGAPIYQAYTGPQKTKDEIATLTFPAEFNVLFVNKEKYSSPLLADGAVIELLPGTHQFLFMYGDIWDISNEEHENIKSKPISLTLDVSAGQNYQITFKAPENIKEARSFAKSPSVEVINTSANKTMAANIEYNIYTESFFSKMLGSTRPASSDMADDDQDTEVSPILTKSTSDPNKINEENGRSLEMLKYWWGSANEQQKKAFQEWINR